MKLLSILKNIFKPAEDKPIQTSFDADKVIVVEDSFEDLRKDFVKFVDVESKKPFVYQIKKPRGRPIGYKVSEETKQKISAYQRARKLSTDPDVVKSREEQYKKLGDAIRQKYADGYKRPEYVKQKISKSMLGKKQSTEHTEAIKKSKAAKRGSK